MKLSMKLGLAIVIASIIAQIIAEPLFSQRMMWRFVVQSMIISWIAAVCVWYGFRRLETETEKAKTKIMDELGLKQEDIDIYSEKFIPLLRKMKDVDVDKTIKLINYGISKLKKIDVDELEQADWGIDGMEEVKDFNPKI